MSKQKAHSHVQTMAVSVKCQRPNMSERRRVTAYYSHIVETNRLNSDANHLLESNINIYGLFYHTICDSNAHKRAAPPKFKTQDWKLVLKSKNSQYISVKNVS